MPKEARYDTGAYVRPDGRAPLIGDSDSSRVLSIAPRAGDDVAHVGAANK